MQGLYKVSPTMWQNQLKYIEVQMKSVTNWIAFLGGYTDRRIS